MVNLEESTWLHKELDSLKNSSLRLSLLLVIRLYQNTGGVYGYKISEKLLELTQGEFDASNATFYAILRRLEKDRLIFSKVQPSDVGPPRKHYFLTEQGVSVMNTLGLEWDRHYYFLKKLREANTKGENSV